MENEFNNSMKYSLYRVVLDGNIIPQEVYVKFCCDNNFEVAIFANQIDFSDKDKLWDVSIRDKDCDKYIGDFSAKVISIEDGVTTVLFE